RGGTVALGSDRGLVRAKPRACLSAFLSVGSRRGRTALRQQGATAGEDAFLAERHGQRSFHAAPIRIGGGDGCCRADCLPRAATPGARPPTRGGGLVGPSGVLADPCRVGGVLPGRQ